MYYLFGIDSDKSETLLATFSTEKKVEKYVVACRDGADYGFCRGLLLGYRRCEIREIPSDPELS